MLSLLTDVSHIMIGTFYCYAGNRIRMINAMLLQLDSGGGVACRSAGQSDNPRWSDRLSTACCFSAKRRHLCGLRGLWRSFAACCCWVSPNPALAELEATGWSWRSALFWSWRLHNHQSARRVAGAARCLDWSEPAAYHSTAVWQCWRPNWLGWNESKKTFIFPRWLLILVITWNHYCPVKISGLAC